jgi:hypothetical protein
VEEIYKEDAVGIHKVLTNFTLEIMATSPTQ